MEPEVRTGARKTRTEQKATGAHFTPPPLAAFVADKLAAVVAATLESQTTFSILDPACGDGELLEAFLVAIPESARGRVRVTGLDTDGIALAQARLRLRRLGAAGVRLETRDFLELLGNQPSLFDGESCFSGNFDAVIANPPYVRTQVMGARRSRSLSAESGLTGRVDLYQAFLVGIHQVLAENGVAGLITSNRFMLTQSGEETRRLLTESFQLIDVIDLGDTKLFSAAVLPAVVVAAKSRHGTREACTFSRVYSGDSASEDTKGTGSVLDALRSGLHGHVRAGAEFFRIETGTLAATTRDSAKTPWAMSTPDSDAWLQTVREYTYCQFADIGKARVGVKTTADKVYIRESWADLDEELRPEPELIRDLITHHRAQRWLASTEDSAKKSILYTHRDVGGKRVPIDLGKYPAAARYLERHREKLAGRKYVIDAGRNWYEIWVPQNPADWNRPKIIFPDISEEPRFFFDLGGGVVNGDCYWIAAKDNSLEMLCLMLGVANSAFTVKYYDTVFHNKLYANRRRFISQYVDKFPLPRPDHAASRRIVALVRTLVDDKTSAEERAHATEQVDDLVWTAFGLAKEVSGKRNL